MEPDKKDWEREHTPGSLMGDADSPDSPFSDEFVVIEEDDQSAADQPTTPSKSTAASTRIGIALDKNKITLVEIELTIPNPRILSSQTVEVGGDSSAAITLALRDAIKKFSSRPRSVDVVLPSHICEYQVISMPAMDKKGQQNYIQQIAGKLIGDKEACYTALPISSSAITSEFLLIAAPRQEIETIVLAMHRAGVIPDRVVPPFAASLSLFGLHSTKEDGPTVLVDHMNKEEVNLLIWDGGKPRVHRNIRRSGGSDRWEEFLDSEVYRTIAYYKSSSGGLRVNKLYLICVDEEGRAASQRFKAVGMFERGVELITLEGYAPDDDLLIPLAAGAATSSISTAPSLDLLPSELRNPKRRQLLAGVTFSIFSLIVVAEILAFWWLSTANEARKNALQVAGTFAESLQHHEKEYRFAEQAKSTFRQEVDYFEKLLTRRIPFSAALARVLSTERSPNIRLESMEVRTNGDAGAFEITLNGVANIDYSAKNKVNEMSVYLDRLSEIPGVRKVDRRVTSSEPIAGGAYMREDFQIRAIFPSQEIIP